MSSKVEQITFPGETTEYREARNQLLQAEQALRRQVEDVAALRRKLPLGGLIKEDYTFVGEVDGRPQKVSLSSLFTKDTLVVYNAMYGPKMATPCPSCTMIVDGLNISAIHVMQTVDLVVVMRNSIEPVMELARSRGWTKVRMLSSALNTFNRDYHAETENGEQMPFVNVFAKRPTGIHHTWSSELLYGPKEPGQDHRHVDMIWPLWNLLDMTPGGRPNWWPSLTYPT